MTKIKDFIRANNLSFEEGCRNTTVVTLVGYAQHLGMTQKKLELELEDEISDDDFIETEIQRLWKYCMAKKYKNFWSTPEAKAKYTF